MSDDAHPAAMVALMGAACFACFAWGTLRHFVGKDREWGGTWGISVLSLAGFGCFSWRVFSRPLSPGWNVACVLFAASAGLWGWALATTRPTPPTLAFTDDDPRLLLSAGPYRWIRHPFYSAYLLFWIAAAAVTRDLSGWIVALVLGAVYVVAARHEEGKFARSALAGRYAAYAARTGMFLPRRRTGPRP